ncbi:hypothetical protein ACP70R_005059 [Stipagrostis hirtigluma subsp. patula]
MPAPPFPAPRGDPTAPPNARAPPLLPASLPLPVRPRRRPGPPRAAAPPPFPSSAATPPRRGRGRRPPPPPLLLPPARLPRRSAPPTLHCLLRLPGPRAPRLPARAAPLHRPALGSGSRARLRDPAVGRWAWLCRRGLLREAAAGTAAGAEGACGGGRGSGRRAAAPWVAAAGGERAGACGCGPPPRGSWRVARVRIHRPSTPQAAPRRPGAHATGPGSFDAAGRVARPLPPTLRCPLRPVPNGGAARCGRDVEAPTDLGKGYFSPHLVQHPAPARPHLVQHPAGAAAWRRRACRAPAAQHVQGRECLAGLIFSCTTAPSASLLCNCQNGDNCKMQLVWTTLSTSDEEMAYAFLKDVNPDSQRWRVKVRVVCFSEFLNKQQPPKVQRIGFVMLDEKNKAMECSIPQRWIQTHRPRLIENHVWYIHYFEVVIARSTHHPVEHDYMARFTKHTLINEVTAVPPEFPLYACTIRSFAELRAKADKREYLVDAIGVLRKCGHAVMKGTKSEDRLLCNVQIADASETVAVALWGNHADEFEADRSIDMSMRRPVVLLFCGITSGYFQGRLVLQASPTCKWYANPMLPESSMLRDSLANTLGPAEWIGAPPEQAHSRNATIAQLSGYSNPHEVWGNTYTVVAKFKELKGNEPWWYMACTACKKRSDPYGNAYKCSNPKCAGTIALPSTVSHSSPQPPEEGEGPIVEFICFGPSGDEMTVVPVEALVAATGGDHAVIPEHITRLYGRNYEFRVSVRGGSLQNENTTFRADSIRNAVVPAEEAAAMHPADDLSGEPAGKEIGSLEDIDLPEGDTKHKLKRLKKHLPARKLQLDSSNDDD